MIVKIMTDGKTDEAIIIGGGQLDNYPMGDFYPDTIFASFKKNYSSFFLSTSLVTYFVVVVVVGTLRYLTLPNIKIKS